MYRLVFQLLRNSQAFSGETLYRRADHCLELREGTKEFIRSGFPDWKINRYSLRLTRPFAVPSYGFFNSHRSCHAHECNWSKRTSAVASTTRNGILCTGHDGSSGRKCERGHHGTKHMGEHSYQVQAFERQSECCDKRQRWISKVSYRSHTCERE